MDANLDAAAPAVTGSTKNAAEILVEAKALPVDQQRWLANEIFKAIAASATSESAMAERLRSKEPQQGDLVPPMAKPPARPRNEARKRPPRNAKSPAPHATARPPRRMHGIVEGNSIFCTSDKVRYAFAPEDIQDAALAARLTAPPEPGAKKESVMFMPVAAIGDAPARASAIRSASPPANLARCSICKNAVGDLARHMQKVHTAKEAKPGAVESTSVAEPPSAAENSPSDISRPDQSVPPVRPTGPPPVLVVCPVCSNKVGHLERHLKKVHTPKPVKSEATRAAAPDAAAPAIDAAASPAVETAPAIEAASPVTVAAEPDAGVAPKPDPEPAT